MGIIVLVSSRALAHVTGLPLAVIIGTMGLITTIYTTIGGNRAVIWTDVVQLLLLVAGAFLPILFVVAQTHTFVPDWYHAVNAYRSLVQSSGEAVPLVSFDPFVRASVLTVALHMFVWHICTHTGNQMAVQRTSRPRTGGGRDGASWSGGGGVAINLLLLVVGLAVFYYYDRLGHLPEGIEAGPGGTITGKGTDQIFPTFVVRHLPPGLAGAVLAAMLGAAMSTISSGINSMATVLSVGANKGGSDSAGSARGRNHVEAAKRLTVVLGLLITVSAYGLDYLTGERNIVEMMPASFNCFTGSLGGLFFVGMFLPRATGRAAVAATLCGLAVSVTLAYSRPLSEVVAGLAGTLPGLAGWAPRLRLSAPVSFTWVMPGSLAATFGTAFVLSRFAPPPTDAIAGLTWATRHELPTSRWPDASASAARPAPATSPTASRS